MENVSWVECTRRLNQHRLELPTEVQWEYACRAGTSTPWSTGRKAVTLQGAANIADVTFASVAGSVKEHQPDVEDGYASHAPVGSFASNAFGLFDVHGNLWEWTRTADHRYGTPDPSDARPTSHGLRINRGGSFCYPGWGSRSAYRDTNEATAKFRDVGVRAAAPLNQR